MAGFGHLVEPLRILLDNRSLTWLVVAFAGITLAEWGYVTALAVDAFRLHGSVAVGLVGFRLFVASIASFFNVPYLERHPSGGVLTAIAGARGAIVATSAVLAATGAPLTPLLILVAMDAFVSAPYRSAQSAMLPVLARNPGELAAAAAGISTVKTLSQALGAIAGGFLLVVTIPAVVFGGAATLMVAAALATVRFSGTPIRVSDAGSSGGARGLLGDTLGVVRHPYVGGLLVVSGLRTFVRGMWIAIAVIASLRLLHAGSGGVGFLMLAAGVGALAAVPLSAALIGRSKLGKPTILAFVACGVPLVLIAGVPVLDIALLFVVAWGVGMAVADVATFSLLHRLLDTPLLPRVTGAIESAKLALEGLGALMAPLLASAIGIRWTLAIAGLPLPAVVVIGGCGLNDKRREFLDLSDPKVTTILVEHRDRFARFGSKYVAASLEASGRRLVVSDDAEVDDERVRDMTELLTSFCARLYGRRVAAPRAAKVLAAASEDDDAT